MTMVNSGFKCFKPIKSLQCTVYCRDVCWAMSLYQPQDDVKNSPSNLSIVCRGLQSDISRDFFSLIAYLCAANRTNNAQRSTATTNHSADAGLMLDHRPRRWANIKSALRHWLAFTGLTAPFRRDSTRYVTV